MDGGNVAGRTPIAGPDRIQIGGVPNLAWGTSGECTFAGALSAATAVTAYPCDYQTTMGATGLAFRVRWFQGEPPARWCPSSPVGEFPEEIHAASRATGWELRTECWIGKPDVRPNVYMHDIVASVRAGLPVLAYDASLNLAVVTGYENGGATLLLNRYSGPSTAVQVPIGEIGPMLVFLGRYSEPLLQHDAAVAGLRLAVRNWRRRHDPEDETRGYWMGALALQRWREDLATADALSDEERASLFFVSWWNMDSMVDARINAGPFLRSAAGTFGYVAEQALLRAADTYDEDAALLSRTLVQKDVFMGEWMGKTVADWTPDVRKAECGILRRAAELEERSIAEIEAALEV